MSSLIHSAVVRQRLWQQIDFQRKWIGIDISEKAAELVVERIKADQGLFENIINRKDIPKRTDLGDILRYNHPKNKTQLYGEQSGYCNGCGIHFEKRHLEVDHIIAENVWRD